MENKHTRIYVDIDSLFDIRQAILSNLLSIEDLTVFINTDEYTFRTSDVFPNVDMIEYDRLNKERSLRLLPRSTISYILTAVQNKIQTLQKKNTFYGENKVPEILLNIYPFKLPDDQIELIRNYLFIKLKTECSIVVINKPVSEITLSFIKNSELSSCFIYNFTDWMNVNAEGVEQTPLIDTFLYFPAIMAVEDKDNELSALNKIGFKDIFSYVEYLFLGKLNINFLPVFFYSNIVTASLLSEKYINETKHEPLEVKNGDSSTAV